MNMSSLNLFRLLKKRAVKLKYWKQLLEKSKQVPEKKPDPELDLKAYTLVDTTHGRKLDLLTSSALGSRNMDQATAWQKHGKAHWLVDRNEQTYKPKPVKIDRQIEFMYDELGLAENLEITILGSSEQQAST